MDGCGSIGLVCNECRVSQSNLRRTKKKHKKEVERELKIIRNRKKKIGKRN